MRGGSSGAGTLGEWVSLFETLQSRSYRECNACQLLFYPFCESGRDEERTKWFFSWAGLLTGAVPCR